MSLWFQPPIPTRTSPSSSREQGFGQVASGFSPFSQDEIDAPQRTSAAEGVMPNFSSRMSISSNIDNSWNFDGPNFNNNSIAFTNELNNNLTQNFEIINLVDSMGVTGGTAGVTSITAGTGISVSSSTGDVTITNTATAGTVDCATDVLPCLDSWSSWGSAANENGMLNGVTFNQNGLTFTSRNLNFKTYGFYNTGVAGSSTTIPDSETWPVRYTWGKVLSSTSLGNGRWDYLLNELTPEYDGTSEDVVFSVVGPVNAFNEFELGNTSTLQAGYEIDAGQLADSPGFYVGEIQPDTIVALVERRMPVAGSDPPAYTTVLFFNATNPILGACE